MKNKIKQNNIDVKNFLTGMKNIIKTSIIIFVGLIAGGNLAFAAGAVLSVEPSSASSTLGSTFDVSVGVQPNGSNVCVIKGTINFNNLSCQNITLANGLMAQTVPTCSAPNFTIGIPKCASLNQNLFSVSVKGSGAGQETLSFSGIKVIGAGTDVTFTSQSGTYNIVTVVQEVPVVSTTTAPTSTVPVVIPEVVNPAENNDSGLQIPSGVGELSPVVNIEGTTSTTTIESSSTVVTTSTSTNKTGGFVATAMDGFSNIPNKLIVGIVLAIMVAMAGLLYYRKKEDINGL